MVQSLARRASRCPINCLQEAFRQTVESHLDNLLAPGPNRGMSSSPKNPEDKPARKSRAKPVWAAGLRRMYDEVVDEQLPDDFADILKKLDQASDHS
jgi:hypothetical protein